MKRLFFMLIVIVFGIGLVGCNEKENEDGYIKLTDRIFVKTGTSLNDEILGDIEMISEIVEEKYEEMIEFPLEYYSFAMSSVPGVPIVLKHPDNEVIFQCTINKGSFEYYKQTASTTAEVGEKIFWCPESTKESTKHAYIDIVVKKDINIVGYMVIEVIKKEETYAFVPKLLKASSFPKINDEYQNITDDQIKILINEVKNR